MKLEKFNRNKKQKKIMITSVIGILVVIGSIILYRTYAYYEESKTFNVLQGKIPEFVENDVTLALTVNGEKINEIPEKGYYKVDVKCDNNAIGTWNYDEWSLNIKELSNAKIKCSLNFTKSFNLNEKAKIGDYVYMVPDLNEYTIKADLTGYDSDITINPNLYTKYIIYDIDNENNIKMISADCTIESITLRGITGWKNSTNIFKNIASSFKNDKFTKSTKAPGYYGQEEYPINNGTYDYETLLNLNFNNEELDSDYNLIVNALGHTGCHILGSNEANIFTDWWISRRHLYYNESSHKILGSLYFSRSTGLDNWGVFNLYSDNTEEKNNISVRFSPVIILKQNLNAIGIGTLKEPYILLG